jgi:hypothetical protein
VENKGQNNRLYYDKNSPPKDTYRLSVLLLLFIVLAAAALRFRLLDVPLERDEGEYAYVGQLMLRGVAPYSQAYSMKMPGIHAAYALILAVFGQTHTGIHLGLLVVNAATTILIFLLAKYLTDSFAGVFAAAAFSLMLLTRPVQGIFANAEHFVVLFAVAGILLLLYALDRDKPVLLLSASVLLGISFLMKQHGIAFIVFAGLYLLFDRLRRTPFKFRALLLRMGLFTFGVVLPFGLTCLVLWRLGVFGKFWFWTVEYARRYVAMMTVEQGLEVLKSKMRQVVGAAFLIWILAGIGLLTSLTSGKIRRHRPFILGFLLFSFLSICPGFYFRWHYFVLLMPAIALLSGIGLFGIRRALGGGRRVLVKNFIAVSMALVVLFFTAYRQKDYLLARDPVAVSRMVYGFSPFPESLRIAEYIKANSSDDDTIAVLGSEPQIYFYANRHSAAGYIYVYPLMESHPFAAQMQNEMIQQIETAKPKFLVSIGMFSSWIAYPDSNGLIFDWFEQYRRRYYRQVGIVEFTSDDKVVYRWDEDAENYRTRSAQWIAVFKRNE